MQHAVAVVGSWNRVRVRAVAGIGFGRFRTQWTGSGVGVGVELCLESDVIRIRFGDSIRFDSFRFGRMKREFRRAEVVRAHERKRASSTQSTGSAIGGGGQPQCIGRGYDGTNATQRQRHRTGRGKGEAANGSKWRTAHGEADTQGQWAGALRLQQTADSRQHSQPYS